MINNIFILSSVAIFSETKPPVLLPPSRRWTDNNRAIALGFREWQFHVHAGWHSHCVHWKWEPFRKSPPPPFPQQAEEGVGKFNLADGGTGSLRVSHSVIHTHLSVCRDRRDNQGRRGLCPLNILVTAWVCEWARGKFDVYKWNKASSRNTCVKKKKKRRERSECRSVGKQIFKMFLPDLGAMFALRDCN